MPTRRTFLLSAATTATSLPLLAQGKVAHAAAASLPPAIAALRQRAHEAVPITLAERQQRADKARALMTQRNLAALCITGGSSLRYFTGIQTGQSERLFAWILPARGNPYLVCPTFEEARMTEQITQIPDGPRTRILTWNEDQDPYKLLTGALPPGTLALDERVQFVFSDGIRQANPSRSLVSAVPIVAGCRSIKSPAELALMQLANDITLSVYKAAWQSGSPGMTNHQFTRLIDLGYARSGVQGEASCEVGEYSALPHGSLHPQVIREGQIVLIDDGCEVEGYQSDISRTFVYGKSTPEQRHVFDVVHQAQSAALAAAHPGVPCQAIDAAARKVITDAGFGPDYRTFTHRLGHGIGLDGHEWPYLVRGNTQPLEAGMTFSDEPGIYQPGAHGSQKAFGIRLEDDWHLTEHGGVLFTPQSPSLDKPFG